MTKDSEGNRTAHAEFDCTAVNIQYAELAGDHLTALSVRHEYCFLNISILHVHQCENGKL